MDISGNIVIIEIKLEQWRFLDKDVVMEAITSQAAEVWHSGLTFLSAPSKMSVCLPHLSETVKKINK